jgi:hypothetical protein
MHCNIEPDLLPARDKGKDSSSMEQAVRFVQLQKFSHEVKGKITNYRCFSSRVIIALAGSGNITQKAKELADIPCQLWADRSINVIKDDGVDNRGW